MELTIAYVCVCVVIAFYGRDCRIGFWGVLLSSVLLTPVVVFYGLLGLKPAKAKPQKETTPTKRWWKLK
ncbi:MAG: hypothetical protein WCG12_02120 [Alcaligenaceae bacterium]